MRLLNVKTRKLEEFFDEFIPRYAILSHTWGADEVLYSHVQEGGYKGGSAKVDGCCAQAAKDGLDYVWIDTCCIDKSSSAELSEAINSMFAWYRGSVVCYVYLVDVPDDKNPDGKPGDGDLNANDLGDDELEDIGWNDGLTGDADADGPQLTSAFAKSRWFTRGWTLQELLAPDNVVFFSASWSPIGRKLSKPRIARYSGGMAPRRLPDLSPIEKIDRKIRVLTTITGIPDSCLSASSKAFGEASVAQKMSWAAGRKTTRREDRAYSLLGIFGVNMAMLYGEGDNAFVRLQEEILRLSDDHSLLAWGFGLPPTSYGSCLLARSPDDFSKCGSIERLGGSSRHYTMTNKGLQIPLQMTDLFQPYSSFLAFLQCGISRPGYWPTESQHIFLPLCFEEGRECHFRDPKRSPEIDTIRNLTGTTSGLHSELTETYIAREMRSPLRLNWDYSARFSLLCNDFDLTGGIQECYPEVWAQALKQGRLAQVFLDHPLRDTILFLYAGGALPRFIAKVKPRGSSRLEELSCVVAWVPSPFHTTSLAELIARGLESLKDRNTYRRWHDALDHLVEWQTDLATDEGDHLSVRVGENSTGKVVINFERKKATLEANTRQSASSRSRRNPKTRRTGRLSRPRRRTGLPDPLGRDIMLSPEGVSTHQR